MLAKSKNAYQTFKKAFTHKVISQLEKRQEKMDKEEQIMKTLPDMLNKDFN